MIFNTANLELFSGSPSTRKTIWSSNTKISNCNEKYGGNINSVVASYGLNCKDRITERTIRKNVYNTPPNPCPNWGRRRKSRWRWKARNNRRHRRTRVKFKHIRRYCYSYNQTVPEVIPYQNRGSAKKPYNGNMSEIINKEIENKEQASVKIDFSKLKPGEQGDPAYGCHKNFVSTYKCGDKIKSTKIEGDRVEAYGKTVNYNCGDIVGQCDATLKLENNGNLVLYDRTGKTIWSSGTNIDKLGLEKKIKIQSWIDGSNLGVNKLEKEQILKRGSFISNEDGTVRLILQNNGNLEIQIAESGCKSFNGVKYGGPWSNAVYSLNKKYLDENGYTPKYLGKVINVDRNDKTITEFPESLLKKGSNFTRVPNFMGSGDIIKNINSVSSEEKCKEECLKNEDCGISNFNVVNNSCNLQKYKITNNTPYKSAYQHKFAGIQHMQKNDSNVMNIRNLSVDGDPSCKIETDGVTTDKNKYYTNDYLIENNESKFITADKNHLCGLSRLLSEERKNLLEIQKKTLEKTNEIVKEMTYLSNQELKFLKVNPKLKEKLKSIVKEHKDKLEKINKNQDFIPILDMNEKDSEILLMSSNYSMAIWSIILIMVGIFTIKMLRK
jgi:hypothetical protein